MKTHIVQLDPYDDATSVSDKMAWGKSSRILLVWPDSEPHILNRRLDLVLLKRRSQELGSQLALVSRDIDVRFFANELNIPIFRDITRAQTARWLRRNRGTVQSNEEDDLQLRLDLRGMRPVNRRNSPQPLIIRIFALLAGVLSILVIAGILIPGASIRLTPANITQTQTFTAITGPNITTLNASGAIPVRSLTVIVEGKQTVDSSGSVRVAADPARGLVLFSNLTNDTVRIEEGTVVLTSSSPSIRYTTTQQGILAAEPGSTIFLPVQAVLPGEEGNASAGEVAAVEGLLGLQLAVTNPEPLTGGSSVILAAPTDLDRSHAAQLLRDSLRQSAAAELTAQLLDDDVLLSTTPFLLSTQQESSLPVDNTPSDIVEVTLRLEFQMLTIPWNDIEQLARTVLDAGIEDGFEPLNSDVMVTFITEPVVGIDGQAEWQISAERTIRSEPSANSLLPDLLGKTPAEAMQTLSDGNVLGAPPEIELSPAWWPRLPLLPIQINVSNTTP